MHQQSSGKRLSDRSREAQASRLPRRKRSCDAVCATLRSATPAALALLAIACPPTGLAAPSGGSVAAGSATIHTTGNLTTITQTTSKAILNWNSFNIGQQEEVNFVQPSSSAVILNRVNGGAATISGYLNSNGLVFLVDPSGILFSKTAQVNVGGLVASTANITDQNFLAGTYRFDHSAGSSTSTIQNQGVIRVADGGVAALLGRSVTNSGYIVAQLGKVTLAAGDAYVLSLGDGLVSIMLDAAAVQEGQGNSSPASINNTAGTIIANGGRVLLSVDTVNRLLDNTINTGNISATSVSAANGVISLQGGSNAKSTVTLDGILQASASAGGSSASIQVSGTDIAVASANVDLSNGASLNLTATDAITIQAPINALRTSGGVPGGSLTASAGNDISVASGIALNDGALTLTSSNGAIHASGGNGVYLQAGNQPIALSAQQGITADSIATSGTVTVTSSGGSIASSGLVQGASIAFNAGSGITIGKDCGSSCVAGDLLPVGLHATASGGQGSGISLKAGGDITLNQSLQADNAPIAITSTAGAVTAKVITEGANAPDGAAIIDVAPSASSATNYTAVSVTAQNDISLGGVLSALPGAASSGDVAPTVTGLSVHSTQGNIYLYSPLGGSTTGYTQYGLGYQQALRPALGWANIQADNGSVELNGLNLDGLADPNCTDASCNNGYGLLVSARHFVVSNAPIAVNKGMLSLAGGTSTTDDSGMDGVYLGSSVFSRGYDTTTCTISATDVCAAGTEAGSKMAYGISIAGQNLGAFAGRSTQDATVPYMEVSYVPAGQTAALKVYLNAQGAAVNPLNDQLINPANLSASDPYGIHAGSTNGAWYAITTSGSLVFNQAPTSSDIFAEGVASGVYDNTSVAAGSKSIPEVVVTNNAANYLIPANGTGGPATDQMLVAPAPGAALPAIEINAKYIVGLDVAPLALSNGAITQFKFGAGGLLASRADGTTFSPALLALSQVPSAVEITGDSATYQGTGVALKVLTYTSNGGASPDASTRIWNTTNPTNLTVSGVSSDDTDAELDCNCDLVDAQGSSTKLPVGNKFWLKMSEPASGTQDYLLNSLSAQVVFTPPSGYTGGSGVVCSAAPTSYCYGQVYAGALKVGGSYLKLDTPLVFGFEFNKGNDTAATLTSLPITTKNSDNFLWNQLQSANLIEVPTGATNVAWYLAPGSTSVTPAQLYPSNYSACVGGAAACKYNFSVYQSLSNISDADLFANNAVQPSVPGIANLLVSGGDSIAVKTTTGFAVAWSGSKGSQSTTVLPTNSDGATTVSSVKSHDISASGVIVSSTDSYVDPVSAGTRVIFYDGTLLTQGSTTVGDGANNKPIQSVSNYSGYNSSGTGFSSSGGFSAVNTLSGAPVVGASQAASIGGPGAGTAFVLDTGGASSGSGAGAGTAVQTTSTSTSTTTVASTAAVTSVASERAGQDALQDGSPTSAELVTAAAAEVGIAPAALADFGRGGAGGGAVRNVFASKYLIATTGDSTFCVSGAIGAADGAGTDAEQGKRGSSAVCSGH